MVGQRYITVLLAKLYAELMISAKEGTGEGNLPENIPDLMLSYLNELNYGATKDEPDNRTVHRDAKALAWECLRRTYWPATIRRDLAMSVLTGEDAEIRLAYLEHRLRLIQTIAPAHDHIRFMRDPLVEYLAGLHIVELHGENLEFWREFLEQANDMVGAPEAIEGFLLAVWDCAMAKSAEEHVPDFMLVELATRVGLAPAASH